MEKAIKETNREVNNTINGNTIKEANKVMDEAISGKMQRNDQMKLELIIPMGGLPKKVVNGVLFNTFLISSVVYFLMH